MSVVDVISAEVFNYRSVDDSTAKQLRLQADRIRSAVTRTTASIIEIGVELGAVKKRLEHGAFTRWVEVECGFTIRSAENYIRAAEFADGKNEFVSLLQPTTLYKLSAKSAPPEIVGRVLEQSKSGTPLATPVVDAMLADARHTVRDEARRKRQGHRHGRRLPSEQAVKRRQREIEKNEKLRLEAEGKAVDRLFNELGVSGASLVVEILGGNEVSPYQILAALRGRISDTGKAE